MKKNSFIPLTSSLHYNGPTLDLEGNQYKEILGSNFCLKTNFGDNCFMLRGERIILAQNFISDGTDLFIIGQQFLDITDFYKVPCKSSKFDIFFVSRLSNLCYWPLKDFLCEGILLPYKKLNVFLPLIHCYDNFF